MSERPQFKKKFFYQSLLWKCIRKTYRDSLIIKEAKEIMRRGDQLGLKGGRGMSNSKNMISVFCKGSSSGYVTIVNLYFYYYFYYPWNIFEVLEWKQSSIISLAAILRNVQLKKKKKREWDFGVFLQFLRLSLLLAWFYVVLGDLHCHWDIEALSSIHNGPFFPLLKVWKKYSVNPTAIKLKRWEESRESHSSNVCSGCNAKCFILHWPWLNFHVRTDWTVLRQLCPLVHRLLQRRQSCSFTPASSFTMLCHCATSRGADSSKSHVVNREKKKKSALSAKAAY